MGDFLSVILEPDNECMNTFVCIILLRRLTCWEWIFHIIITIPMYHEEHGVLHRLHEVIDHLLLAIFIFISDAFDHKLMLKCLSDIRSGKSTQVPVMFC